MGFVPCVALGVNRNERRIADFRPDFSSGEHQEHLRLFIEVSVGDKTERVAVRFGVLSSQFRDLLNVQFDIKLAIDPLLEELPIGTKRIAMIGISPQMREDFVPNLTIHAVDESLLTDHFKYRHNIPGLAVNETNHFMWRVSVNCQRNGNFGEICSYFSTKNVEKSIAKDL
jgi:hypothetical protein